MLFRHPYLIESEHGQADHLGVHLLWPSKPHSGHNQYFIFNSPRMPVSLGGHFNKALDDRMPQKCTLQQLKEALHQAISSVSEELANREMLHDVLINPDNSWVFASFTPFGISLTTGGGGRVYHLVQGTKWRLIQPEQTTPQGKAEWRETAFIAAESLTAGDYILLTTALLPEEFREQTPNLLSEKNKLSPYKRAQQASQFLLQAVPGRAAYLIDILGHNARSIDFEPKKLVVKPSKAVKAAPAALARSKHWSIALVISFLAAVVLFFVSDFINDRAPREATKKYTSYESRSIKKAQRATFKPKKTEAGTAEAQRAEPSTAKLVGLAGGNSLNGLVKKIRLTGKALGSNPLVQRIRQARAIRIQGKALYDKSKYAAAFGTYMRAAEQGDKYAQFYLGLMYIKGIGTRRDSTKGLAWIEQAANQSLLPAQQMLLRLKTF